MKLTKPQRELLRDVAKGGNAAEEYPPARKLIELGLCIRERVGISSILRITPAGRNALDKERG
ncbi:UNVERIFIED_ORG: hypothetical protein J2W19_003205 [Shinella zoogloeoides]|nr:hypothetical protein [Shinella zoogloeoides]